MNKLLLLSGNDLPFIGGKVNIRQPKLKDIALLGENTFYLGSNFLCFSKQNLKEQDKVNLENLTDFEVLMSIINAEAEEIKISVVSAKLVLQLLFPDYELVKMPNIILLNKSLQDGTKEQVIINQENFDEFKQILTDMFCLSISEKGKYNPANKVAAQIAKKLEKRHQQLNKAGKDKKDINILYHYISVLTLGNHHTIPQLMEYTVYQLFNEFQRFERKHTYDTWFKAKLAGAENLQDVEHWLNDEEDFSSSEQKPKSNKIEF